MFDYQGDLSNVYYKESLVYT